MLKIYERQFWLQCCLNASCNEKCKLLRSKLKETPKTKFETDGTTQNFKMDTLCKSICPSSQLKLQNIRQYKFFCSVIVVALDTSSDLLAPESIGLFLQVRSFALRVTALEVIELTTVVAQPRSQSRPLLRKYKTLQT